MEKKIRFALIGDCHYSTQGNYATRDCAGAKNKLAQVLHKLNRKKLDFVLSLGDVGDGRALSEVPEMLEVYKSCKHPLYFAVGNHDLVQRSAEDHAALVGMPAPFYDFSAGGFRFIVLNAFEQSRYSAPNSAEARAWQQYRAQRPWLLLQEWPGLMTEASWARLADLLNTTAQNGEDVILISHVPTWSLVAGNRIGLTSPLARYTRIPDFQRMLDLMDKYTHIRAYFAGHFHAGGIAVRNGVLHKTVRAVANAAVPTACVVTATQSQIRLEGMGEEAPFTHAVEQTPVWLRGTAPQGSWVMTNCGAITRVGRSGTFLLRVPAKGMYAIKAVKDGCRDVYLSNIEAPASDLHIKFTADPTRKLYTGRTKGPAQLLITDHGEPVRWFDVAGTPYGSVEPENGVWHEHSCYYWSNGRYAFTACGEVTVRELPHHTALPTHGWYKGDLHAHLIHGECLYIGNVQQAAFIGRAEGYNWLYMTYRHGNDGYPTDAHTLVKQLSDQTTFFGLNQEFPKAHSNHFGNAGVEPPTVQWDPTKISSLELAEEYIWKRGGITVPVHPFEGHMSCRELCLWLLCAPEKVPCMDFFYHDNTPKALAEEYWFMLLNRGYHIGCFATSDASFDIGRTPGSNRGATYVYMNQLSEQNLIDGIMKRHTMVSWDCAALVFSTDSAVAGDILSANGKRHTLRVTAYWQKQRSGTLRMVRNGTEISRVPLSFTKDEESHTVELTVCETENSWYVPILESEDGRIRSAASPIRFVTAAFKAPEVLPLPRPCPEELLAECEALTPQQLAKEETLDAFAEKLRAYAVTQA